MKKKWTMTLVSALCAITFLPAVGCSDKDSSSPEAGAYVSVDINPGVEFITDDEGIVLTVRATNEDASVLLSDMSLEGKSLKVAVREITKESEALGYIHSKNKDVSILATADEPQVEEKVEELAEQGALEGSSQAELKPDEKAALLAEEVAALKAADPVLYKNLTVAKLKLAKSIMEFDPTFTVEQAANMRTRELVKMLHEYTKEYKHMCMESLKGEFEARLAEEAEAIYAQIDAFYGEAYAGLNALIRQLDALEEKFEDELDKIEDALEWEAIKNGLDEPDFDDELMTDEMKAELALILPESTIQNLEELEDYIEELEDQAKALKSLVSLTEEQRAQISELYNQLKEIGRNLMDEFKTDCEAVRATYQQKKQQRKGACKK